MNELYDFLECIVMSGLHGRRIVAEVISPAKVGKTTAITQLCSMHEPAMYRVRENTTAYKALHNIYKRADSIRCIAFDDFSWLSPSYIDDFISRVKQIASGTISYDNFNEQCKIPETRINVSVIILNNEASHAKASNKMKESGLEARTLKFRFKIEPASFNRLYKDFYYARSNGGDCKIPFKNRPLYNDKLIELTEAEQDDILKRYDWTDITNVFNLKLICNNYGYDFKAFEKYITRDGEISTMELKVS